MTYIDLPDKIQRLSVVRVSSCSIQGTRESMGNIKESVQPSVKGRNKRSQMYCNACNRQEGGMKRSFWDSSTAGLVVRRREDDTVYHVKSTSADSGGARHIPAPQYPSSTPGSKGNHRCSAWIYKVDIYIARLYIGPRGFLCFNCSRKLCHHPIINDRLSRF